MKEGIHPKYKKFTIRIGNEAFETMSASSDSEILMDVNFMQHPAWTGKGVASASNTNQNVSAFNKRFSGINFGTKA
jgi:large subunit ribosomal protein L31